MILPFFSSKSLTLLMQLIFISFEAVFAQSVDPYLHILNHSRKGALHRLDINMQTLRVQTLHTAAALTVKMRMGRMVSAGPQAINERTSATAEPLDQAMVHEQIKDSINRYTVYRCAALEGLMNICGRERKIIVTQNLQYAQAVFSDLEAAFL